MHELDFLLFQCKIDHLKLQKIPMKGKSRASNRSSVDKECKKEAAINRPNRKVNYGDLLWVQLHGSSWWPAQIADESTISAIHKPRDERKGEVLVRLYGSYKYLFIDPNSSSLEFEDTLNKYSGNHNAILKESLKLDLHQLKFGKTKKKEMKMKGKVGPDTSQERIVKQNHNIISKSRTSKVPSSGCSSSRELGAKSPAKRSKETNLGLESTKEKRSRKRKKEEAPKKSKSNSTKSATEGKSNRKERKIEPHNKISARRKEEQDMERQKPKNDGAISPRTFSERASAGSTPKTSLKRASFLSNKSEQGNKKKLKQSDTQKHVGLDSPNSKLRRPQGSASQGHSSSAEMGSLTTKVQTGKTVERKREKTISQVNRDAGKKKNAKATEQEILSTTLEETAKEPSKRKLKVMRFLGLVAPAGSPFIPK